MIRVHVAPGWIPASNSKAGTRARFEGRTCKGEDFCVQQVTVAAQPLNIFVPSGLKSTLKFRSSDVTRRIPSCAKLAQSLTSSHLHVYS